MLATGRGKPDLVVQAERRRRTFDIAALEGAVPAPVHPQQHRIGRLDRLQGGVLGAAEVTRPERAAIRADQDHGGRRRRPGFRRRVIGQRGCALADCSVMKNSGPDLHMLNLVVDDMRASLDFYRQLGIAVPDGGDAAAPHVQLRMPGGFSLELDTAESARLWHAAWRTDPATVGVVIGFSLPTREAVDERYAELTSAGYAGRQPPFDAFWGARYAIVADPDGNDVGLMSPIDESRRTWPPETSPAP
jgi:uncharacterized glyoxalase superfamily protein PhnB